MVLDVAPHTLFSGVARRGLSACVNLTVEKTLGLIICCLRRAFADKRGQLTHTVEMTWLRRLLRVTRRDKMRNETVRVFYIKKGQWLYRIVEGRPQPGGRRYTL